MRNPIKLIAILCILVSMGACSAPEQTEETSNFGGLALYTLRDTMSVSPKAVLEEVHDIGYAYVEAAGYQEGTFYGMEPAEFKTFMNELGLEPKSTHMGMTNYDNADQLISDAKAAGFTYFVIPVPPMGMFTYDPEAQKMGMDGDVEELAGFLNTIGEKASAAGLQLLYHNHDFELEENEDGVVVLDYLLENTNPEHVNFQLDLYWATRAGADPIVYFENYPGRFKSWHVKDMDDQERFAPVSTGTIDFARILEQKETSGMEFYFVEQDMTFNHEPMQAIRISHEGLESFGFE